MPQTTNREVDHDADRRAGGRGDGVRGAVRDLGGQFRRGGGDGQPGRSVFAAVFLVVPLVAAYLPASIEGFAPLLPSNAGGDIWGAGKLFGGHQLGPWTGFAVLCGYAAVLTGLAARRLRRRDT